MELHQSKEQGVATMIEWDGNILGYAAGIGILIMQLKSNEEMKTLIANASVILCPVSLYLPETMNHIRKSKISMMTR